MGQVGYTRTSAPQPKAPPAATLTSHAAGLLCPVYSVYSARTVARERVAERGANARNTFWDCGTCRESGELPKRSRHKRRQTFLWSAADCVEAVQEYALRAASSLACRCCA